MTLLPDQPPPTPGTGDLWRELIDSDPTWDAPRTIAMCEERRLLGIARYGTPLQRDNGRDYDVDRLTAALAEAEATLANERGEGEPPSEGWEPCDTSPGRWEHRSRQWCCYRIKSKDYIVIVRGSLSGEIAREKTARAAMRAAERMKS